MFNFPFSFWWVFIVVTGMYFQICQKKLQTRAAKFECDEGDYLDNGLCYEKCKDGYTNVGPRCWLNCPSGFRDDGAYCAKKTKDRGSGFFPPVRPKERKVTYG